MLTKVLLHMDGVLCAAVAVALPRSLELVRVAVFSAKEAVQGGADAWGASELLTFKCACWKRISAVTGNSTHSVVAFPRRCAAGSLYSTWPRPGRMHTHTDRVMAKEPSDASRDPTARPSRCGLSVLSIPCRCLCFIWDPHVHGFAMMGCNCAKHGTRYSACLSWAPGCATTPDPCSLCAMQSRLCHGHASARALP